MTNKQPDYLAYLVRLWRAVDDRETQTPAQKPVWRASIEDPHTHEQAGFASLEALFDFLREMTHQEERSHTYADPDED
jgi:hypothetical protein